MTTTQYDAPYANGILELTDIQKLSLLAQLKTIKAGFVATHEQPVCDTFYLVVEHTKKHKGQATFVQLNGDTAEFVLASEVIEVEGV